LSKEFPIDPLAFFVSLDRPEMSLSVTIVPAATADASAFGVVFRLVLDVRVGDRLGGEQVLVRCGLRCDHRALQVGVLLHVDLEPAAPGVDPALLLHGSIGGVRIRERDGGVEVWTAPPELERNS
jgi:hypothetical protein